MDLQLFLALNAVTISAMAVAATIIYRPQGRSDWLSANAPWLAVNAAVVIVGLTALWFAPEWAGLLVLALFVPFVMAPIVLFNLSQRYGLAGRTGVAARFATAAALLHPTTANWMNAHLLTAIDKGNEGDSGPLDALAASAPPQYRPVVQAYRAVARRDWSEVLALSAFEGAANPVMKPLEIRALGETGQIDAMVRSFWLAQSQLTGGSVNTPKLAVLAFGGRPDAVERLLADKFKAMDADYKTYWMAVAAFNGTTDPATGQRVLTQLAASAHRASTRVAAQCRLDAAAMGVPRVSAGPATGAALEAIAADVLAGDPVVRTSWRPAIPVTLVLIALNVIGFAAELLVGDAEDSETLIQLGALWPPNVFEDGQWWRVLSAAFLHFGAVHIISNMFVLFVLGRLLEPMIGSLRLLAVYLIGGVASSAFVLWLMWMGLTNYGLLVGASGAIFALFGAEVMIVLREWQQSRGHFDNRRLTMLAVILLLQMGIDLSVPNISFSAHASGFVAGLLMMAAMLLVWPQRSAGPVGQAVTASTSKRENSASGPHA